jgi:HEAT repeat protein
MRVCLFTGLALLLCGCGRSPPMMAHYRPVSDWVQALNSPDARLRKQAVTILGNVGPSDLTAVPALARAVRDRDPAVRTEAVLALLKIGPAAREAIPALEEAVRDINPKVRTYAAKALFRIGG